jgi:hypothetical protein
LFDRMQPGCICSWSVRFKRNKEIGREYTAG